MQRFLDQITDKYGNGKGGLSVRVQTYPGGVDATIYSDNGSTVAANPLTTDANGEFSFYAADGRYQLVISGTGITSRTITDIVLEDVAASGGAASVGFIASGIAVDTNVSDALDDLYADTVAFSGLTAYVPAFKMYDNAGTAFTFAGDSVTLQASLTQHIYVDLFSKALRVLRHKVHRGGILVATVTTDASSVSSFTRFRPQFPKTRIGRTLARLKSDHGAVIVGLMGDSLTGGASATPFWRDLLFDSSTTPATWRVNGVGTLVTARNYAIGGSTSHLGFMQTGRSIAGSTGAFGNTQVTYGPKYMARNFTPGTHSVQESSIYECDLVVIGFGANGGTQWQQYLELTVRKLRERDIDVIIQTESFRPADLTALEDDIQKLSEIAENYGCELADTWSYMREAYDASTDVFDDSVHQSSDGHEEYAAAIRSVIHDYSVDSESRFNYRRVNADTASSAIEPIQGTSAYVLFTPHAKTGADAGLTATPTDTQNPSLDFGGKTDGSTECVALDSGEYAEYGCSLMGAIDLIVDTSDACEIEVYKQNGGTLVTTLTIADANRLEVVEVVNQTAGGTSAGLQANALRFKCTSGTARILGMVTHAPAFTEIAFANMDMVGTWAREAGISSHDAVWYSDTANDYVHIPFTGTGIHVLLSNRTAAGIVDVYLDGVLVDNDLDLYTTASQIAAKYYWIDSTNHQRGYGEHVLTIVLVSANASAGSAAAANRRLGLYGAYALDGR